MSPRRRIDSWQRGYRRISQGLLAAAFAGVGIAALSGLALASSPATLSIAKGVTVKGKVDNVVVNSRGVTVYTLSGDSIHHLECTQANHCFSVWPPVTIASAKAHLSAAHGIKGKLGTLHRDGFNQITLGGRPLYTFIGDGGKKRTATGEGIVSFGGTWHVIATASGSSPAVPGPTTTTTSTSSTTTSPY